MNFYKLIRNFIIFYLILFILWFYVKDLLLSILFAQLCVAGLISIVAWTLAYFFYDLLHYQKICPENKAVLITGCDTGFGHELAKRLDKLGFTVFAGVLFPNGAGAKQLQINCSNKLTVIKLDVTEQNDVENAIDEITKTRLSLWAIVNNAGIAFFVPFDWGNDVDDYKKIFDVNVFGAIRVTKNCIPLLRQTGGRIVNVASLAGRITTPSIGHYSMTKHSIRVFSDFIRRELYDSNVQVITLEPTFYQTAIIDQEALSRVRERIFSQTPDAIKKAYNEPFTSSTSEKATKLVNLANQIARSNVNEVIDAMENAVTLEHPKPYYRCCGYHDLILWGVSHAPEVIIDFGLHLFKTNRFIKAILRLVVRILTFFKK